MTQEDLVDDQDWEPMDIVLTDHFTHSFTADDERLDVGYDMRRQSSNPNVSIHVARKTVDDSNETFMLPLLGDHLRRALISLADAVGEHGLETTARAALAALHNFAAQHRKTAAKSSLEPPLDRLKFIYAPVPPEGAITWIQEPIQGQHQTKWHIYAYLENDGKTYVHHYRTGPKLQVKPTELLRVPTTEYAKDALMVLGRGQFIATEGGDAVFAELGKTQLRIECDSLGFDTLQAIEMLAAYGPATMQTFLGLMGLWIENNPDATHETYFTARVSDLMRYMHRRESSKGGYNTDDQMQKGREVYILSRATVPRATVKRVNSKNGSRTVETLTLDRLLHVQTMTAQRTLEDGQEVQSILEFRYHPNKEMHEMLCGDTPQFAEVSGKLLGYHPVKEKYQIMLGFGLAFYDRVNKKHGKATHKIGLQSLLTLAGIEVPKRNVGRFLEQIQAAVNKLSADGVITGAAVNASKDIALTDRQKLATADVVFPALSTQRNLT